MPKPEETSRDDGSFPFQESVMSKSVLRMRPRETRPAFAIHPREEWRLDSKVAFLASPQSYPERPWRVEAIQTHMSWIFLTEHHAFKLKKPVSYDYLDFSTLEARHRWCREEVRINRRLAPGVYLTTIPLTVGEEGMLEVGGLGPIVDWLVMMRRLPSDRMLDAVIRRGTLTNEDVASLAGRLAGFYVQTPPVSVDPSSRLWNLKLNIEGNHDGLETVGFGLDHRRVDTLHRWQLDWLKEHSALAAKRAAAGRVVEGHGDLRAQHVCLLRPPAAPVVIDSVEFNRDFRLLDVGEELASLAMECERMGEERIGPALLSSYEEATGDVISAPLFRFYKVYRAYLRARLSISHLLDPTVGRSARW
ncbi:MAG TPA: hypothetical protein VKA53_05610, partial [Thermoanaerobaculia bacterium]|nr:hypothetical protein [Thermoanaerobaculia bacterium]